MSDDMYSAMASKENELLDAEMDNVNGVNIPSLLNNPPQTLSPEQHTALLAAASRYRQTNVELAALLIAQRRYFEEKSLANARDYAALLDEKRSLESSPVGQKLREYLEKIFDFIYWLLTPLIVLWNKVVELFSCLLTESKQVQGHILGGYYKSDGYVNMEKADMQASPSLSAKASPKPR